MLIESKLNYNPCDKSQVRRFILDQVRAKKSKIDDKKEEHKIDNVGKMRDAVERSDK